MVDDAGLVGGGSVAIHEMAGGRKKKRTYPRFLPGCGSSRLRNQPTAACVTEYCRVYCCTAVLLLCCCCVLVGAWLVGGEFTGW